MNSQTPLRLAAALRSAEGREHYRQAFLSQAWLWLGRLPWEVQLHRKLDGRLPIRLSTRDPVISRSIFATGVWELQELRFIKSYMKPGMVAIDIGANIGAHTLVIADRVGPTGIVHAFEPTRVFETLQHNITRNGFQARVHPNQCALGAEKGTARFIACKPGYELFTSRGAPLTSDAATGEFVEFPVITLDQYTEQHGIHHIHFLKIDVEGSEDSVFQGCSRLLANHSIDCMMLEINDICLANSGASGAGLLKRIHDAGYYTYMLDETGFEPLPESVAGMAFNVIAMREPMRITGVPQEWEHASV